MGRRRVYCNYRGPRRSHGALESNRDGGLTLWGWFFYKTSWWYIAALVAVVALTFWLELSNLTFAILLSLAFCVGLTTAQLLDRWVAWALLGFAVLLSLYVSNYAITHGIGILDVLLIRTEFRNISKPMTGVYGSLIGAIYIVLLKR